MGGMAKSTPIVLAAGGTGGHMFPAEALASELLARGRVVALVTDRRGQSFGERVPDITTLRIRAGRFDVGLLGKVVGVAELIVGIAQAALKLRALSPAAVIGFGGYPSVPTVLAAARLGIPTVIHEQNAILGRANHFLAPRVCRIALSFAATGRLRPAERARAVETGNPVRPAIAAQRERAYGVPTVDGAIEILVTGGSQGARIFGEIVPAALARLPARLRAQLRLSQQARPEDVAAVRAACAACDVAAEIASFFEDVPTRLARAQLVIARSGASTVAELAAVGRPALLVPYPHAADDHQSANARAFAEAGAGWMLAQPDFTAERLAGFLTEMLAAPDRLAGSAAAAKALGRPLAARSLADLTLAMIGANGNHPAATEDAA
jgi:UDP-N-acetylglucosamine--N-acetylmuramyl-(pentapeptide) pyrophosphoryl-undecaprenol N-acetylglucosamine transferase